jgi:TPR repeat protein
MAQQSFFKILWAHIQRESARELESNSFTGFVSFALTRATRLILTGLGPVGSFLADLSEFFIKSSLRAIGPAYEEWQRGYYRVSSSKSGLTVLERPMLITPQHNSLILPERLEIPTKSIVTPPKDLVYNPSRSLQFETPYHALLSQIRAQSQIGKRPGIPSAIQRRSNFRNLQFITDVAYPQWLLEKDSTPSTTPLPRSAGSRLTWSSHRSDILDWYLSNSGGARNLRKTLQNVIKTPRRPELKIQRPPAKWNLESMSKDGFHTLKQTAQQGDSEAQFQLGKMYVTGRFFLDLFVEQNKELGYQWITTAATQGHSKAKEYLRTRSRRSKSDLENVNKEQFHALKQAAQNGDPEAQFQLGKMFVTGRFFLDLFVEQNKERGYQWITAAAKQGHSQAQEYLRTRR